MTILLCGAGTLDDGGFSFVSSGASYVGRTCTADTGYVATWTIEGVPIGGLAPGTVALIGDKTVKFKISPGSKLTRFDCNGNTLTGKIPSLN